LHNPMRTQQHPSPKPPEYGKELLIYVVRISYEYLGTKVHI